MDELAYSETLADWRTHDGIDIKADAGTQVLAASSGTVLSVADDDLMGTTVVIAHDGGYETTYPTSRASRTVAPEQYVSAGQVIGAVGTTRSLRLPWRRTCTSPSQRRRDHRPAGISQVLTKRADPTDRLFFLYSFIGSRRRPLHSVRVGLRSLLKDRNSLRVRGLGEPRHEVGREEADDKAGNDLIHTRRGGETAQQPAEIHHEAGHHARDRALCS